MRVLFMWLSFAWVCFREVSFFKNFGGPILSCGVC